MPFSIHAHTLSYQQMATLIASGGYQTSQQFFLNQQGLLAFAERHLHYHVQCQPHQCTWQNAKLHYMPAKFHVSLGYDKRFQSHMLSRSQPFFGISASFPNHIKNPETYVPYQRWIGISTPLSGLLKIDDPTGTVQQSQSTAGGHILANTQLPQGAYPVDVATTSPSGETITQSQFIVNTDITRWYRHAGTQMTIGFPTNQATSSSYGLPPIHADIYQLMLLIAHRFNHPLGSSQATLNLQSQQLALGFNTTMRLLHGYVQPDLLWMFALPYQNQQSSLAMGVVAQGALKSDQQWRFLATTYPKTTPSNALPWVVHSEWRWQPAWLLSSLTYHASQTQSKNYIQGLLQYPIRSSHFQSSISLSSLLYTQGSTQTTLTLSLKEKNRRTWRAQVSNDQQTFSTTFQPLPKKSVRLHLLNNHQKQQQRLGITSQWQNAFAKWRIASTMPLQDHRMTWSLEAKTGLAYADRHWIWTPLSSVSTPYILRITPTQSAYYFYWGDPKQLRQQGLVMEKKRPYQTLTSHRYAPSVPEHLYPGNLCVVHPDQNQSIPTQA